MQTFFLCLLFLYLAYGSLVAQNETDIVACENATTCATCTSGPKSGWDCIWCESSHSCLAVERASGDDVLGCKNINYLTCKVNMWYVSGGTIAFLLLLPITIICCCCCCKKKPEPNYALSLNAMVDDQEYLISNKKKDRRNAYSTYEY